MASILLFHSVRGLRPAEREWAERMRAAGHQVTLPDLFDGATSESVEGGFVIQERIGWDAMMQRARAEAAPLAPETVLAGISAGAQIAGAIWQERPAAAGLLLLHGPCEVPASPARGRRVQAHLAEPEPYDDEDYLQWWAQGMRSAGLDFALFRYPGVGHYFTDASLADYSEPAAKLTVARAIAFLEGGPGGSTADL